MGSDYRIALLCNAYSTNQEYFSRPMAALVDTILGTQKGPQQPPLPPLANNAALASGPTTPLSMSILDSLTVHSKMSLIHSIVTHVIKLAQSKSNMALAPALVETYSRLLVYTEIESLGIKGFISKLKQWNTKNGVRFVLFMSLAIKNTIFCHVMPCSLVDVSRYCGGTYCLRFLLSALKVEAGLPSKYQSTCTRLHNVTSQKVVFFIKNISF